MDPLLRVDEEQEVGDAEQREEDQRRPDGLLHLDPLGLALLGLGAAGGEDGRGRVGLVVHSGDHDPQYVDQEEQIYLKINQSINQ